MRGLVAVLMMLVALFALPSQCVPGGYDRGDSYGGGAGEYGGHSVSGYATSGYGGNYGPKSSAAEALKSFYNNLNGYNYNFGYDVKDYVYGNYQSRQESGSADPKGVTRGSYTVVEPDGSLRTVNYEADWVNGFRATVSDKNGVTQHGYNTGYGNDNSGGSYGGSSGGYSNGHGSY